MHLEFARHTCYQQPVQRCKTYELCSSCLAHSDVYQDWTGLYSWATQVGCAVADLHSSVSGLSSQYSSSGSFLGSCFLASSSCIAMHGPLNHMSMSMLQRGF